MRRLINAMRRRIICLRSIISTGLAFVPILRAAHNGHAKAQYRLGKTVLDCPPVARREAIAWLTRSAQGGYHRAQYLLALCFAKGIGVACDQESAYLWMCIARVAGNDRARPKAERLAEGMAAEAIACINLAAVRFNERRSRGKTLTVR